MRASTLPPQAREEAGHSWCVLEAELGGTSVMASWDWTGAWLEHYGDVVAPPVRARRTRGRDLRASRSSRSRRGSAGCARRRSRSAPPESRRAPRCSSSETGCSRATPDRAEFRERADGGAERSRRLAAAAPRRHGCGGCGALLGRGGRRVWQVEESPVADLARFDEDGAEQPAGARRRRMQRTLSLLGELQCEWAGDASEGALDARGADRSAPGALAGQGPARRVLERPLHRLSPRARRAPARRADRAALFRVRRDERDARMPLRAGRGRAAALLPGRHRAASGQPAAHRPRGTRALHARLPRARPAPSTTSSRPRPATRAN